ncbi:kelch protein, putative [Hepatocystis sp. ex Piliocolobus tephrosceles]|nr:kelch protein, putative [Hepatocystis sp. ex Piliocolobus tephrosceles]
MDNKENTKDDVFNLVDFIYKYRTFGNNTENVTEYSEETKNDNNLENVNTDRYDSDDSEDSLGKGEKYTDISEKIIKASKTYLKKNESSDEDEDENENEDNDELNDQYNEIDNKTYTVQEKNLYTLKINDSELEQQQTENSNYQIYTNNDNTNSVNNNNIIENENNLYNNNNNSNNYNSNNYNSNNYNNDNDNNNDNNNDNIYDTKNKLHKFNDMKSRGFCSPPVFHLTEIMHNEKCFKKITGHISVEINGDICIYGGMSFGKCIDNFIRYVPGINLFEKIILSSQPIRPRAYHAGNVIKNDNKTYIVIFGGINDKKEILNETYMFDIRAKKWEQLNSPTPPCARYKHASFIYNNNFYIHGGLNKNNKVLSDFWVLSKQKWRKILQYNPIPPPRFGHSISFVIYENMKLLFLFGGNNNSFNGALSDLWLFNTKKNKWKDFSNLPGTKPCGRWGHAAQMFDNEWMIIYGGVTSGWIETYALADMYALNIYSLMWFKIDISASKSFNRGFYGSLCLVPYKKSLHVFGGSDEANEYSDVFSLSPLVTYVSYKFLVGKIEDISKRMVLLQNNTINETGADTNTNSIDNTYTYEEKIADLKEQVERINEMMRAFELKFTTLEALNEECKFLLSKNVNSEDLERLEARIEKLEKYNGI